MSENQTLPKEASRHLKPDRSRLKKPLKARALTFGSSLESSNGEAMTKSFTEITPNPDLSASPGSSLHSELTQSSEVKPGLVSFTDYGSKSVGDSTTFDSLEVEIVAGLLRKATSQVLNSPEAVDLQSKKLLEALIEISINMLQTAPKERDIIDKLLQARTRIILVFILLCLVVTVLSWIFGSGSQSSFGKPPPT